MKTILFLRYSAPYATGDIATFDDAAADAYIEAGVASEVPKPRQQAAPPQPPESAKRK